MIEFISFLILSCNAEARPASASILELASKGHNIGNALVVDKTKRTISVWTNRNGTIESVLTADVDIGKGSGEKLKRGDLKTPEGIYFFTDKKVPPNIDVKVYGDLAFTTNYPNYFDLLWSKTGDGIWLHAIPENVSLSRGSKGCVVVRNETIKKLQSFISIKHTPLIILDEEKIDFQIQGEVKDLELVDNFLSQWQQSWIKQNMTDYLSKYSSRFYSNGMDLKRWAEYKRKLAKRNVNTSIIQSGFTKLKYDDYYVVIFSQAFTSEAYSDKGEKVLYLSMEAGGLKIVSEEFLKEDNVDI